MIQSGSEVKTGKLVLSLFCIALVVMTLVFVNQLEMDSRKISDLEHQVELLENSTTTVTEALIRPQMWSQSGSPPWQSFTYDYLPYGFQVVAGDYTNGTSYVCNRAFGYNILGPLPNHLWVSGTVKLFEAAQSGQSWSRIAFVMAVHLYGGNESYIELDVYDSPNSPVGPGKPGVWTDVYEYNKYQLREGEQRLFSFDIGQEFLNHYADSSRRDILSIHLYFVLESQTATRGGWSIAYSLSNMGYWETT